MRSIKTSGIYCFIHRESGKCYVGSSIDLEKRKRSHIFASKPDSPSCFFHKSLKRLGVDSFDFEKIEECGKDELLSREKFWITFYDSVKNGFNTQKDPFAFYGYSFDEATRKRISESMKVKNTRENCSIELLERRRRMRIGKKHSPETRLKMSISAMGNKRAVGFKPSLETREKISRAMMGNKSALGFKKSEETRRKTSESHKGKVFSKEHCQNISKSKIGKMAGSKNPFFGKKHSKETLEKISKSIKETFSRKRSNLIGGSR